jgi:hypothetical protein
LKFAVHTSADKQAISGWISPGNSSTETVTTTIATVSRNNAPIVTMPCDIQRDDVKSVGLHLTGACGFRFSKHDCGLVEGNLYKVDFTNLDQLVSKEVLFGDQQSLVKEFDEYEILPRNDFSVMNSSTEDLFSDGTDLINLKRLMIRLRRGKRAYASRLVFKGHDYAHQQSDWIHFRNFIATHIDFILASLTPRYIWSIVDTFVDYAETDERFAALSISNMLFQERFAQTFRCIYDLNEKEAVVADYQLPYWGGMKTNQLKSDDAYDVFITKNLECLENTPLLKKIFIFFLLRMMNEESSILGVNMKHSPNFSDMATFYKKNLSIKSGQ